LEHRGSFVFSEEGGGDEQGRKRERSTPKRHVVTVGKAIEDSTNKKQGQKKPDTPLAVPGRTNEERLVSNRHHGLGLHTERKAQKDDCYI